MMKFDYAAKYTVGEQMTRKSGPDARPLAHLISEVLK
jgi:hypothetical protein